MEIRSGRVEDFSQSLAQLIWAEDPVLMAAEFGDFQRWVDVLAVEWGKTGAANSHETVQLAWEGDAVVGLMTCFAEAELDARYELSDEVRKVGLGPDDVVKLDRFMVLLDRMFPRPQQGSLYVQDLSVADGMQGRGVGFALLSWAADRARALGCSRLCLDVYAGNPALAFYQRFGLQIEVESRVPELETRYGMGPHYHMSMVV